MKIDIIMPVFNRARYIPAALRSLLRQNGDFDLEIIVVDDGSTDETAAIVHSFADETGRVRLVQQENRGVTAARNKGLLSLRPDAQLVSFLDSDDIAVDGYLADSVARFRADSSLAVSYGLITLADLIDEDRFEPAADSKTVTVRGVSLSAGLYRRDVIEATGGFDEAFVQSEDLDLLFRIFERGPKLHKSNQVAVIYRRHAGNMTLEHKIALKYMMMAVHNSLKRRKADPSLVSCEGIFDFTAMRERNVPRLRP